MRQSLFSQAQAIQIHDLCLGHVYRLGFFCPQRLRVFVFIHPPVKLELYNVFLRVPHFFRAVQGLGKVNDFFRVES